MEEIETGDFVYHKEYGKGICLENYNGYLNILFEGGNSQMFKKEINRKFLFKKGDPVVGFNPNSEPEIKGIFSGWTDSLHQRNKILIIEFDYFPNYCTSIKHQEEKLDIRVDLTVDGVYKSPSTLSEETWMNLRGKK